MAFLEARNLDKDYSTRNGLLGRTLSKIEAVKAVSFRLLKGETLGLVGESGSGKSTLSRMIMQLERPTSGEVLLEGEPLHSLPAKELRHRRIDFQMVFQDPYASLNPRMTVYSTLAEALTRRDQTLSSTDLQIEVSRLLERVGLSKRDLRKYPHEFSGGQRQRIAIARAIAPQPKLLVADEPVSALDVSIQSQVLNLLRQLKTDLDLTMIFISHDLSVVRFMADKIAVMQKGQFVEEGNAESIFSNPSHPYTKELLGAALQTAF